MIKFKSAIFADQMGISKPKGDKDMDALYLPYKLAPVIISDGKKRLLKSMNFSLIPSWSPEPKVKFATHNARLYSVDSKTKEEIPIYKKPVWRGPFASRRCLIPMTHFIEPIYTGKLAGNMVAFTDKNPGLIVAAGIWEEWVSKNGGEVIESFSILTDDPIPFVKKTGHARSPVFIDESIFDEWLEPVKKDGDSLIKLLRKNKAKLSLEADIHRPMASGWERRIPK